MPTHSNIQTIRSPTIAMQFRELSLRKNCPRALKLSAAAMSATSGTIIPSKDDTHKVYAIVLPATFVAAALVGIVIFLRCYLNRKALPDIEVLDLEGRRRRDADRRWLN
jgi:hypothetical protein